VKRIDTWYHITGRKIKKEENKFSSPHRTRLYAIALSVYMPIMQITSFVCLSPTRTCRPLDDWSTSVIVLAAMTGHSVARQRGLRVSQMFSFPWKTSPSLKFMLAVGAYSWRTSTRYTRLISNYRMLASLSWVYFDYINFCGRPRCDKRFLMFVQ